LRSRGISILITDHQVRETLEITDRSYVVRAGQVLCHGRPEEVLRNPEARKYYFGEGMDIAVRGHGVPAPHIAPIAAATPQSRLAALRSRLTGRAHPPDEAA
jgi:lipopolysaccharide export system ATP-binding protein